MHQYHSFVLFGKSKQGVCIVENIISVIGWVNFDAQNLRVAKQLLRLLIGFFLSGIGDYPLAHPIGFCHKLMQVLVFLTNTFGML